MRVLFTSWAWPSHLYAMVPLAWACRAAGHEVMLASQPGLGPLMERTGLPSVTVGHDVDSEAMVREYVIPADAVGPARPPVPTVPAGGDSAPSGKGPRALRMLLSHAESMTGDLVDLARSWRAELVVSEPTALAGPLAAGAVGVPAVRHLYGPDLMLRAAKMLPEVVAPLAEKSGAGRFDALGSATIDPCPPSLRMPGGHNTLPVRYVPSNGPGGLQRPPLGEPSRPRICVTWGHTMARLGDSYFLAPSVVRALAGLDAEVVAVVSERQHRLLGDVPEGVKVLVDVPLHQVVPGCSLVVAHGGAGTMLTALSAGVPLLLVPQLPDHAGHASRLSEAGAGRALSRNDATADRLRKEAAELLADCPERAAAGRLAREMSELPTPSELVPALESIAADGRRASA